MLPGLEALARAPLPWHSAHPPTPFRSSCSDLEQALLLLPFASALQLLGYLAVWLEEGTKVPSRRLPACH